MEKNNMSVNVHLVRVQDTEYQKLAQMADFEDRTVPQQLTSMIKETYKRKMED